MAGNSRLPTWQEDLRDQALNWCAQPTAFPLPGDSREVDTRLWPVQSPRRNHSKACPRRGVGERLSL